MKPLILALSGAAALSLPASEPFACTRALYTGPDGMVATGRTMDWREDPQTNLYLFPRGVQRRGGRSEQAVRWTSRYGSVIAAGYDIGITDGMNERGLSVNLLVLPETVYALPDDTRPVMGLSIWALYVLDNFATVSEAVEALSADAFRIDAPDLPGGGEALLHMAVSDATGDSAILEYLDGRLTIHHGRAYRVLTNSPVYDAQLAIDAYWRQIGGFTMLPGTNRSSDRFVRASFYVEAVEQSADPRIAVPALMSVMRNVSVPYGITSEDRPYTSSTRWRTVCDQKNRVYYFEPTLSLETFWIDLAAIDLGPGSGERTLRLTSGEHYAGDATDRVRPVERPFEFLFAD